jgi:CheY-like chemotaxis protein/predicted negative regulator of RcsB-dependent stress response
MDLQIDKVGVKADSNRSVSKEAFSCCQLAKQFEKAGEYRAAYEALEEFWPDTATDPNVESLADLEKAEVLLRAGSLAGWLGSVEQNGSSQEHAKNLITRAIEIFERLEEPEAVREAQSDLAVCYWREGAFDEARILLDRVIDETSNDELKTIALVRVALVEKTAGRFTDAMARYEQARPLVDASDDHALKGTFHNGLGMLLNCRGVSERRQDFIDSALIEFAAASFHFEQAGNDRFHARVENNLGYLFFTIGRYRDAHTHLDQARFLFLGIDDVRTAAQVDETRARLLLAEGQLVAAERVVRGAIKTLERGDEQAILAEALTTHGVALARLGNQIRARSVLERAADIARTAGDPEGAGRAYLTLIEELGEQISLKELISTYRAAIDSLRHSEDLVTIKRVLSCGESLLAALSHSEGSGDLLERDWNGFSLKREVKNFEHGLIERALRDASGSVTKAAYLLGFKHHQSLISLLGGRHKALQASRRAVRKRRRRIVSRDEMTRSTDAQRSRPAKISVLHVEDNEKVARTVADFLDQEGLQVDSCSNGLTALKILKGNTYYDAIILDNGLPGLNGLQLTKRIRKIAHRRSTPIIMFSGDDVEREAWRVGVDEFLLKPEALNQVSTAISRLVKDRAGE